VEIAYEREFQGNADFVTGAGAIVGDALVQHPKTPLHRFHRIEEVGLRISESRKTVPGQMWIKRTVLEMGGKDSIIVDEEATSRPPSKAWCNPPSVYRAECSPVRARSCRQKIYDNFVQKLVERTKQINVGKRGSQQLYGPV